MKNILLTALLLFAVVAGFALVKDAAQAQADPLCIVSGGALIAAKGEQTRHAVLMYCDNESGPILRFVGKEFYAWYQQQDADGYDAVVLKGSVR